MNTKTHTPTPLFVALLSATLSFDSAAPERVQLLPAGEFVGRDGRPGKGLTWKLSNTQGCALAAQLTAKHATVKFNFDYEHQTMQSAENGQPAPASGWCQTFEWQDDMGLFATNVQWTKRAIPMIEGDEYKYISPVITYTKDGTVTGVINAALVNVPNLDMSPLTAACMARLSASFEPTPEEETMNPVLKALLAGLGLAYTATEQEATAALSLIKTSASQAQVHADQAAELGTEVAALKAKTQSTTTQPDPTKWVSMDAFTQLNTQVAALSNQLKAGEVDDLISAAKAEGKILAPAVEAVWRNVGKADVAQLKALIDSTPANPALAGKQQSENGNKVVDTVAALSNEQLAVCRMLGQKPEDYLATLKASAAASAA
ncbi:phage protease [Limnohabitans sp.]|uniref:phage protease n=1 Tax=Limnohabitans sp. TaxID=1907725 RepID=UPI00286F5DAB|nr:phage protease [Limnohabitans sp.]